MLRVNIIEFSQEEFTWSLVPRGEKCFCSWPLTNMAAMTSGKTSNYPSSDTQGQIVGARESLNRQENMARRKVKKGEKSLRGQCLTRPVPNCRGRSGFWLVPENFCVSLPNQKAERRRQFGTGLVRHCPQGLFSPFFSFLRAIFSRPFRLSLAPHYLPMGLRGWQLS